MGKIAVEQIKEIEDYLNMFAPILLGDEITIVEKLERVVKHYATQMGRWHKRYPPKRYGRPRETHEVHGEIVENGEIYVMGMAAKKEGLVLLEDGKLGIEWVDGEYRSLLAIVSAACLYHLYNTGE